MKNWNFGAQIVGRSLVGGVTGGITSTINGGKFGEGFGQGAITGSYEYLYNYLQHPVDENGKPVVDTRDRPYGTTNAELAGAAAAFSGAGAVVLFPAAIVAGLTAAGNALSVTYLSNPGSINEFVGSLFTPGPPNNPSSWASGLGSFVGYVAGP